MATSVRLGKKSGVSWWLHWKFFCVCLCNILNLRTTTFNCKAVVQVVRWETTCLQTIGGKIRPQSLSYRLAKFASNCNQSTSVVIRSNSTGCFFFSFLLHCYIKVRLQSMYAISEKLHTCQSLWRLHLTASDQWTTLLHWLYSYTD